MTSLPIKVRAECPEDVSAIRTVVRSAFPTDLEARLVDLLRDAGRLTISMVAVVDGRCAGHIAFSPVTIDDRIVGLGLAPVAVLPEFQGRGVGGRLIRAGLEAARSSSPELVVVLGEPAYYARFGFEPAARRGLRDEYGGGSAFQVIVSDGSAIPAAGGLVRYGPEFAIFGEGA